jgi:hypothetical protein
VEWGSVAGCRLPAIDWGLLYLTKAYFLRWTKVKLGLFLALTNTSLMLDVSCLWLPTSTWPVNQSVVHSAGTPVHVFLVQFLKLAKVR